MSKLTTHAIFFSAGLIAGGIVLALTGLDKDGIPKAIGQAFVVCCFTALFHFSKRPE